MTFRTFSALNWSPHHSAEKVIRNTLANGLDSQSDLGRAFAKKFSTWVVDSTVEGASTKNYGSGRESDSFQSDFTQSLKKTLLQMDCLSALLTGSISYRKSIGMNPGGTGFHTIVSLKQLEQNDCATSCVSWPQMLFREAFVADEVSTNSGIHIIWFRSFSLCFPMKIGIGINDIG